MPAGAQSRNFDITVAGKAIPDGHFVSFTVDRDMNQADHASIVLSNQNREYNGLAMASPVEVKIGNPSESVYKGEIVGLEPHIKGGGKSTMLIQSFNKLHRLIRKRKSITFTDKTDQQILHQVVSDSGLTLDWKYDDTITYHHVYQHNRRDLDFVLMRAGRLGCQVWCVDTTVNVHFPDTQSDSGIKLTLDPGSDGIGLKAFRPRISSAPIVKKVTVKGWNPETKELFTGTYEGQSSSLGGTSASSASGDMGSEETFQVDTPIWSQQEAKALAKGKYTDLALGYITGEAETLGSSRFDLGQVVNLSVGGSDPFNGKYLIVGISHRFAAASREGMTTNIRLARDAQGDS